jgi:hypothetical protein
MFLAMEYMPFGDLEYNMQQIEKSRRTYNTRRGSSRDNTPDIGGFEDNAYGRLRSSRFKTAGILSFTIIPRLLLPHLVVREEGWAA